MFTVISTENGRPAEVGFGREADAGAQRLDVNGDDAFVRLSCEGLEGVWFAHGAGEFTRVTRDFLESYFADLIATCESAEQARDIERERDRLCGLLAEAEAGTCEWSDVHEEWPWPTG